MFDVAFFPDHWAMVKMAPVTSEGTCNFRIQNLKNLYETKADYMLNLVLQRFASLCLKMLMKMKMSVMIVMSVINFAAIMAAK